MVRRHRAALFAAILAGLWGGSLGWLHARGTLPLLDSIEAPLVDMRFLLLGERPAPETVTILAVDDETVREAGAYPLPRATLARLVEAIGALEPKAIALDVLFLDAGEAQADRALAAALSRMPSVIAAAGLFDRSHQTLFASPARDLDRIPVAKSVLWPLPLFAEQAAVGVVNAATDSSGVPRHIPLLMREGTRLVPSFSLRAAALAAREDPLLGPGSIVLGAKAIPTDLGYALPLRFYGPRGTVRTLGASKLLRGHLSAEAVRGKVVVVGATVTGGGDVFPTPFDPVLPGVEVMATAIAHLTAGDGLVRDGRVRIADASVAALLPVLLVLLLAWRRNTLGFVVIAGVALAWTGLTIAAFAQGLWLSMALPLAAAAPPTILFGAARLWLDRKRVQELAEESSTFQHFQPPSLAKRLKHDPSFLASPIRQDAALVFIDLSGFTGLSERLGPDRTRDVLRGFHVLVDEEASSRGGFVGSFMGDGAMLIFGLPEPGPEDACHAVEACVGLCLRTRDWLASLPEPIGAQLGFKIGAHYGPIIASRLGGGHEHITAIGDTVNVASRLMEVAASHQADVALSENLFQAAGAACAVFDLGLLDATFETAIRGRSGPIAVRLWRGPAEGGDLPPRKQGSARA